MTSTPQAADADVPTRDVRVRAFLPTEHRRARLTAAVSLLVHALAIAVLVRVGLETAEERGRIANALQQAGGGGGGGTGGAEYVLLQAAPPPPPPAEAVEPPLVVPTMVPPTDPEPQLRPEFPVALPDSIPAAGAAGAAGSGGGAGGGEGTGQGPGQGSGVGPGSGGGSGGGAAGGGRRGTPPESRFLIIPPLDQPRSLRGTSVVVTFHIDARGQVTALEVTPPIRDRGYARKFDEAMRKYEFKPARDADGRAVAGILPVTVSFSEN